VAGFQGGVRFGNIIIIGCERAQRVSAWQSEAFQRSSNQTARMNIRREAMNPRSASTTTPEVGIFWLINGKLLIDSTPLSESEPYGTHQNPSWQSF
jgi:hypothetical protein